jgi:hypothetical protein
MGALDHGVHPFLFFDGFEEGFEFTLIKQVRVAVVVMDNRYDVFLPHTGVGVTFLEYDAVVTVATFHA